MPSPSSGPSQGINFRDVQKAVIVPAQDAEAGIVFKSLRPEDITTAQIVLRKNSANVYASTISLPEFLGREVSWHFPRTVYNDPPTNHIEIPANEAWPLRHMEYLTYGKETKYAVVQAIQCTAGREGFEGYMAVKSCILKDKDSKKQAYNELEQLLKLRHNHIVALVGSFKKRTSLGTITSLGLVMFPVAAWDLAKYLSVISAFNKRAQESNAESPKQSLLCHDFIPHLRSFFACLCQALLYLHRKRIKHRDIKPANVLIDAYQVVMFADFGIAKSYKTQEEARTDGPTWKTIHYAPRQAFPMEGQPKQKRGFDADIFSLGCVFLEMVTVLMGESLEELWKFVFPDDEVDQGGSIVISGIYWQHLDAVAEWINHLKDLREYRINVLGTRDNACLDDEILNTIFLMMSNEPRERPSLQTLCETFNEVALNPCEHCHPKASRTQLVA